MKTRQLTLFPEIKKAIKELNADTISEERKEVLQALIDYIQSKSLNNQEVRLNFICTHNSRRSHLSQIWAQTMASYFDVKNVNCYSAGTEATTLFPAIVETLKKSGFQVEILSQNENPVYSIKFADNERPIIGFSKTIASNFNPKSEFAAIMTCSQADGDCPYISGAERRIPITFEDPKIADNTPQQEVKYMERSLQIAAELFYVFSKIKS
jgi:arsenate reductase